MADLENPQPADTPNRTILFDERMKELDLRLKELDIQNKEYEGENRPSLFRTSLTNPAVIAAAIAAWASLTAGGLTWLSGTITANTQRMAAEQQAELDFRKFQSSLILDSVRPSDTDKAAGNLQFLIQAGLLTGETARQMEAYLTARKPGQGKALPPR
jgi:hypothetical protein